VIKQPAGSVKVNVLIWLVAMLGRVFNIPEQTGPAITQLPPPWVQVIVMVLAGVAQVSLTEPQYNPEMIRVYEDNAILPVFSIQRLTCVSAAPTPGKLANAMLALSFRKFMLLATWFP
jgi:hypothetical protein